MKIRSGRTWWSSVMNLFEERPVESRSVLPSTGSTKSHTMIESFDTTTNSNSDHRQGITPHMTWTQSGPAAPRATVKMDDTVTAMSYQEKSGRISFEGQRTLWIKQIRITIFRFPRYQQHCI